MKKPPLGIMPEKIWEEKRIADLSRAIYDHTNNGYALDVYFNSIKSWCDELIRRVDVLDSRRSLSDVARKMIVMAQTGSSKIECIKKYREYYPGAGLKKAKKRVETICAGYFK